MFTLNSSDRATLCKQIERYGAHSLSAGGWSENSWHVVVPILHSHDLERFMWKTHRVTVSSDMFELPTRKLARRLVRILQSDGIHAYITNAGAHAHN